MRRRPATDLDSPSYDSFLDIVANLVGILLILIVVIGVRAKDAVVSAKSQQAPPPDAPQLVVPDVRPSQTVVQRITADIASITGEIEQLDGAIDARFQQRGQLQALVTSAERTLAEQRGVLDASQQRQYDLENQVSDARRTLDDLSRQREAAETSETGPTVITHLPTPLAETVFGQEEHFRLLGKRLVYVPLNDLVTRLKEEAPRKAWKLKEIPAITETIGPLQGFYLRYTLHRVEQAITTRSGPVVQRLVELDHFDVVPVTDDLGESVQQALQPESQFRLVLKRLDPNHTTITIWTYPDSFDEFRQLKLELYQLGYLTAARPLPDGQPISGSPRGTKSAAQ